MIDYIFYFINQIQVLVENNYILTLLIYFAFSLIFFTTSMPGGTLVITASGFLYGFYIGFLINIFSVVIGSLFFFIICKYFMNNYFNKYIYSYANKLNKIVKKSSYEYLILIRLIFGIPLFIQNIFLSTLNISNFKFFLTTFIGFSPYMIIFAYAGNQFSNLIEIKNFKLSDIFSLEFIFVLVMIIVLLILKIYFKKIK